MASEREFTEFVKRYEPRIRTALVSAYGPDRGREATAEALAHAWENWDKIQTVDHPVAYLYRVGQSKSRPRLRPPLNPAPPQSDAVWVEPELPRALDRLSRKQRQAVVLVHAYGWTQEEAGRVLGISAGTVKTHLERGLAKLRAALEVTTDA